MSTSGGSSGGSASFPITLTQGGLIYTVDAGGGVITVDVHDVATGNFVGQYTGQSDPGGASGFSTITALSALHSAEVNLQVIDGGGSSITLLIDGRGLTLDANGNPVWSGTRPVGQLYVATAHLNAAAIATLFSAPTTLVAAAGAGVLINPIEYVTQWVPGVLGFAGGFSPGIYYGVIGAASFISHATNLVGFGNPNDNVFFLQTGNNQPIAKALGSNQPIIEGVNTQDPDRAGPIVTATLAGGGTGYVAGDTGTIDTDPLGYTGGATYLVTAVAAVTGAVTAFTVTAAGDGYTKVSNPLTTTVGGAQPGIGVNFTANVTAIPPNDGDLYVTLYYTLVTLH